MPPPGRPMLPVSMREVGERHHRRGALGELGEPEPAHEEHGPRAADPPGGRDQQIRLRRRALAATARDVEIGRELAQLRAVPRTRASR